MYICHIVANVLLKVVLSTKVRKEDWTGTASSTNGEILIVEILKGGERMEDLVLDEIYMS